MYDVINGNKLKMMYQWNNDDFVVDKCENNYHATIMSHTFE
jgi:hypothetical protein